MMADLSQADRHLPGGQMTAAKLNDDRCGYPPRLLVESRSRISAATSEPVIGLLRPHTRAIWMAGCCVITASTSSG